MTLAAVVVAANLSISAFAQVRGGVLGYASDITIAQVLTATNHQRDTAGLPSLSIDPMLNDAARRKAADMFTFDYWAHVNPQTGREPWWFFVAVGYKYRFAGENLARDFDTTAPLVQAWINSPTHRDNLLSPRYEDTGIAVVNGTLGGIETTLVVQLFGQRQAVAAAPQVSAAADQKETVRSSDIPDIGRSDSVSFQQFPKSNMPALSPLLLSKAISLATLILLAIVILVDSVIIWRRRTHRLVGRNWAHLMFIATIAIIVSAIQQGVIR